MPSSSPATLERDTLITTHMAMARRMARKMARRFPRSISHEDLESAAVLGLTEAASRYDETRNEAFMAFAAKRVRGAIFDHLRTHDVLSRRGRRAARRVAETTRQLVATHGREVSDSEIAAEMGVSDGEFQSHFSRARNVTVIALEDLPVTPLSATSGTPKECSERQQMRAALAVALEALEPRELLVLVSYYRQGLSLRRIGEILGLTESRICQIHSRALGVLREHLL